jgi:hypothetical protein
VGTNERSSGFKITGDSILDRKSIPAEAAVSYAGKLCFDLLMILICIGTVSELLRIYEYVILTTDD